MFALLARLAYNQAILHVQLLLKCGKLIMARMKIGEQYYTASEVKERLGITQGMFNNYIRNGSLKPIVPPGKRQGVYLRSEVDQLAREMQAFLATRNKLASTFGKVIEKDLKATVAITRVLFGLRDSEEATVQRRLTWIRKNPDTLYALKVEEQVIGYAIMLPLKREKIERILKEEEYSQEVSADEIEEFKPGKTVNIYLMGIGVIPGLSHYEKRTYGARLVAGLMTAIIDLGKRGIIIDTLIARSDTPDGIRILKKGFTEVSSDTHTRNFLINVKESGIPFIQEYKQALAESSSTSAC